MDGDFKFDEWPELKRLIPQFNSETIIVRCPLVSDFRVHTTEPLKWTEAKEIWHDRNGKAAWAWRVIGSVFNRPDWFRKGRRFESESVQIKTARVMNICREWYIGHFGYSASVDTLIVSGELERIEAPFSCFERI